MYKITQYSSTKFVLRGNTRPVKKILTDLKGRYNPNLKGGSGWLFKNECRENVQNFIDENNPEYEHFYFKKNILFCSTLIPLFILYLYY